MSQLALTNIINISIATPQPGIGAYNTSNLAIISRDTVNLATFGTLGYKIYTSPTQVATDFGTGSNTYAMANAVFSQQPNILLGGGYLVIIPFLSTAQVAQQTVTIPLSTGGLPASTGAFVLTYSASNSTSMAWNAISSVIQTSIRAITGLTTATVTNATYQANGAIASFQVNFVGVSGAAALMTVTTDTLADSAAVAITPTVATTIVGSSTGETLDQAIIRSSTLVQYFGVMASEVCTQAVLLLAASVIQSMNKLLFDVTYTAADVASNGRCAVIQQASFTQTRCLFYDDVLATALTFMAAYAGLGLSTVFTGSNTTQTMHLKTLAAISPDPNLTQTLLTQAVAAGADTYPSLQGVSKVFCSGLNDFFDNQYNLQWFAGALQVAGFNYLATTNTKIPQTEIGMDGLKGAYRAVCEQAVANQFLAPGTWNSATTFGNISSLVKNVAQRGYYIYSQPISLQSQAARVARQAPLVQMAIKYAGAIQSTSVIVYVNQ
jgi:hypothetical protein